MFLDFDVDASNVDETDHRPMVLGVSGSLLSLPPGVLVASIKDMMTRDFLGTE
jgi:hypothetical protein